jgi:hypothetical protein
MWVIEGQNDDDHAKRVLGGEIELTVDHRSQHPSRFMPPHLSVVVGRSRRPDDLVDRFLERLAHFAGEHFADQRPGVAHFARRVVQQLGALMVVDLAPPLLSEIGNLDGEIDFRRRGVHDLADVELRGGVDYRGARTAGTRDQTSIDQMMAVEIFEGIEGVQANSFDMNPRRDYRVRVGGKSRLFPHRSSSRADFAICADFALRANRGDNVWRYGVRAARHTRE